MSTIAYICKCGLKRLAIETQIHRANE